MDSVEVSFEDRLVNFDGEAKGKLLANACSRGGTVTMLPAVILGFGGVCPTEVAERGQFEGFGSKSIELDPSDWLMCVLQEETPSSFSPGGPSAVDAQILARNVTTRIAS